jgi:hypothetical protein
MVYLNDFYNFTPRIRVATMRPDGTLYGYSYIGIEDFLGTIPVVGDVFGTVWNGKDYDFQIVQRRYFIREYQGENYWLLVVRDAEPSPQLDEVSVNALLVTDMNRAVKAGCPEKELLERIAQLSESPPPGAKRYKPKARKPDEN